MRPDDAVNRGVGVGVVAGVGAAVPSPPAVTASFAGSSAWAASQSAARTLAVAATTTRPTGSQPTTPGVPGGSFLAAAADGAVYASGAASLGGSEAPPRMLPAPAPAVA